MLSKTSNSFVAGPACLLQKRLPASSSADADGSGGRTALVVVVCVLGEGGSLQLTGDATVDVCGAACSSKASSLWDWDHTGWASPAAAATVAEDAGIERLLLLPPPCRAAW